MTQSRFFLCVEPNNVTGGSRWHTYYPLTRAVPAPFTSSVKRACLRSEGNSNPYQIPSQRMCAELFSIPRRRFARATSKEFPFWLCFLRFFLSLSGNWSRRHAGDIFSLQSWFQRKLLLFMKHCSSGLAKKHMYLYLACSLKRQFGPIVLRTPRTLRWSKRPTAQQTEKETKSGAFILCQIPSQLSPQWLCLELAL